MLVSFGVTDCAWGVCAQQVSSTACGVLQVQVQLQLAEVLWVQHMVLVALPGWQVGVWM